MRSLFALCIVAGCYAPSIPANVPCATVASGPRCPGDQVCVNEVCVEPGSPSGDAAVAIDAPIDGSPFSDLDGDGIPDSIDKCPTIPDPMQYDEDGDNVGDACDPCPMFAENVDSDGDGVGDACDPHPNIPGDHRVLFVGFNDPSEIAGWLTQGTWTISGGEASVTVAADERAFLAPPITPDINCTVSAGVTPTVLVGNLPRGIGVTDPSDDAQGIECELLVNANDANHRYGLVNLGTGNVFASNPLDWNLDTPYALTLTRTDRIFDCSVRDPLGVIVTQTDNQDISLATQTIAIRTRSISGKFAWMMFVDSP